MHENTNSRNGSLIAWALNGSPEAFWAVLAAVSLLASVLMPSVG